MRTIKTTRYVTPLREGGSLPAIVEADDENMYVLKFRGAGQGPKALIAELLAGELARAAGLPIPEIVLIELDSELARTEPDSEIQDLLRSSVGLNLALKYLPGSIMFDPVAEKPTSELASAIVWFDAYISNVDRTVRNTNMLMWHEKLWLIDHGAAFYFHHNPATHYLQRSQDPFQQINKHVLLPFADSLLEADQKFKTQFNPSLIESIVELIPDIWLEGPSPYKDSAEHRKVYLEYLLSRLNSSKFFVEEANRGRSMLL